jgi:hypothetical protein
LPDCVPPRPAAGIRATLAGLLLLGVAAGCGPKPPAATYTRIDRDLAAVRAAFNADSGKVRVLLLLSPT